MKKTKIIMGIPITVEIVDLQAGQSDINRVFDYFKLVDQKFSTYKKSSEITKINKGKLKIKACSLEMKQIFKLASKTKQQTKGFFDITQNGQIDPSGIVKGWAI